MQSIVWADIKEGFFKMFMSNPQLKLLEFSVYLGWANIFLRCRYTSKEMEFLDITLTKDLSLLLHALQSLQLADFTENHTILYSDF
jgi:hypothetical protein